MAIKPIDLPAAAGLDYSGNDVRHFSQGDEVSVAGLTNPTRNLAQRDNALANKLNEVVEVVNNHEQFIPLTIPHTNVPSLSEIVVANYRIPAGFEARVLNAVVGTTPTSTNAELDVYYSASFGGSTGTSVVTTTPGSEFTGDVNFYQTGEFIIVLKNTGASTLEIASSVTLTMRPLGAEGTLLVGSIIVGEKGQPGQRGGIGPQGRPGTGGAGSPGSPGMVFIGNWTNGITYHVNEVINYAYSGTYGSWICRAQHVSSLGVNDPQNDLVTWQWVAFGVIGPIGASGTGGSSGSNAGLPTYATATVNATLVTGNDWLSASVTGYGGGTTLASNSYSIPVDQHYIESGSGPPKGYAWLAGVNNIAFRGSGTITLPTIVGGAKLNFTNAFIDVVAMPNGAVPIEVTGAGTNANLVTCYPVSTTQYVVKVLNNTPIPVSFLTSGLQPIL